MILKPAPAMLEGKGYFAMPLKPALLLAALAGLSACSSTLETCVRQAEVPYREALERKVELEHLLFTASQASEDAAAHQRTDAPRLKHRDQKRNYAAMESYKAELKAIDDSLPRLEAEWKSGVFACRESEGGLAHLLSKPTPPASEPMPVSEELPVIWVDEG